MSACTIYVPSHIVVLSEFIKEEIGGEAVSDLTDLERNRYRDVSQVTRRGNSSAQT